ncbi:MAG: FHA domain-containing protein, partial [Thermoleophilia bacterium]|nr:FHA domain-containing protein [Thermoleophilia bacterium]
MPVDVLEVTRGQDRGARFAMLGDRAVIGRSPVADLVLTDPAVGHRHARLRLAGARLQV